MVDFQLLRAVGIDPALGRLGEAFLPMNCLCNHAVNGIGDYIDEAAADIGGDIGSIGGEIVTDSTTSVAEGAAGGGFFGSIGEFFGSNFGSSLLKGGLTIGSAYAISQLGGSKSASGGTVLPGQVGSGQPPAGAIPGQTPATPGQTPAWVLPVALAGGAALLVALLMRRR